ncbi:thiazole tautomerase TenI [Aquibacillus sediminis]|uniref:thiazole tautomerase TenI n=1 Tax=Aquibacillus sediminis TaxID=2574734 RepID=UPI00319E6322
MKPTKIHIISTGKQEADVFSKIAASIHPYVDAIHIREKSMTAKQIYELVGLLQKHHVPLSKLVINDRIDVAYATKVGGVQLGYRSMPVEVVKQTFPGLRIGCSVHSLKQAKQAEVNGADYLIYGHIFPTNSKPNLTPRGIEQLKQVNQHVQIPVFAIGGIKPSNVHQIIEAGTSGIAVMSGVLEAANPVQAVNAYVEKMSI